MIDGDITLSGSMLVLGGARSGKSRFAERVALATGLTPVYVATAQAFDDEMAERIAQHKADRGPGWRTVDAPRDLAETIGRETAPDHIVLVDCLTLWLTNVMLADETDHVAPRRAGDDLVASIAAARGPLVLVSNETGLGIVPENALARRFRDAQGRLNQAVAEQVAQVVFLAAGLPLVLKPR